MRWPGEARRAARRHPDDPGADERIWGRHYLGPAPWVLGLFVTVLLAVGIYLAFAKELPWNDEGYTLEATFENTATLRESSPVRIAGVNVGEVTSVEADGDAAKVTFTVEEEGRPIHSDAQVEIRPRLFLEGNFFLDLSPGSPSAPELDDGGPIPITQTATAVQLDEVLTALQQPDRRNLQRLLEGFGTGLTYEPTAADDTGQDPSVAGETAAESLNDSLRLGGPAGRDSAIVNEALLGENPHDLSGLIRAQAAVFAKLASRESDLAELITNFNATAAAFADESENLSATLAQLAPTLEQAEPSLRRLSAALPPLRALAVAARPGIRELPATISAGTPWLHQAGELLRDSELGGLARLLRETTPGLAEASASARSLFREQTLLGRCASDVIVPTGDVVVNDAFSTGQPNYREFLYSTVQITGESQSFDGNGPFVRFQTGGGDTLVQGANPQGGFRNTLIFGNTIEPPDGVQPALTPSFPPWRMDVPCHENDVPDINGPAAAVAPADLTPVTP